MGSTLSAPCAYFQKQVMTLDGHSCILRDFTELVRETPVKIESVAQCSHFRGTFLAFSSSKIFLSVLYIFLAKIIK